MLRQKAISLGLALLAALAFVSTTMADEWRVAKLSGQVWISTNLTQPVSLSAGMRPFSGSILSTGSNGRVMLMRGNETMLVGPSTVLSLRGRPGSGQSTTILQRMGEITFDVDKRNARRFSVETPIMAAVVKGTRFTVAVSADLASVSVARGRVEVAALASGHSIDIAAGQTVRVTPDGKLTWSGRGRPSEVRRGRPRAPLVTPFGRTFSPLEANLGHPTFGGTTIPLGGAVNSGVGSPAGAVGDAGNTVGGTIGTVSGTVGDVGGAVGGTIGTVSGTVGGIGGAVGGAVGGVGGTVGGVGGALGGVSGAVEGVGGAVGGTSGQLLGN